MVLGDALLLSVALLLRVMLGLAVGDCTLLAVALIFGEREDESVTLGEALLLVAALPLRVALLLRDPLGEAVLLRKGDCVAVPDCPALKLREPDEHAELLGDTDDERDGDEHAVTERLTGAVRESVETPEPLRD